MDYLFVLYPNFTQLDFAGPYEVFARLPSAHVRLASPDGGTLRTEHGLTFCDLERLADVSHCDVLCVPGGSDHSRVLKEDALSNVRRLAATARYVTSVCNGSLVLAAAGLLAGRRSACHWAQREQLRPYGAVPDAARVVRDGHVITGAGVTAGIDFALTCAAEFDGEIQAQLVQLILEYAPAPPFQAGRPETAPTKVLRAFDELIHAHGRTEAAPARPGALA